jgi:hypothetical protein
MKFQRLTKRLKQNKILQNFMKRLDSATHNKKVSKIKIFNLPNVFIKILQRYMKTLQKNM